MLLLLIGLTSSAAPLECPADLAPTSSIHVEHCVLPEPNGLVGHCVVELNIDATGTHKDTASCPEGPLQKAAVQAVAAWTFEGSEQGERRIGVRFEFKPESVTASSFQILEGADHIAPLNHDGTVGQTKPTVDGPEALSVDSSQMTIKRQAPPTYPSKIVGLGDIVCDATIWVNAKGRLQHVELKMCPKVFREPAIEALNSWRWVPMEVDGVNRVVTFDQEVVFLAP
ncbi:MAG: hypothetical protein ACI9MC_004210 [Kiritimatiellia bacterium]|jgi:hypothetical protein